jgi:hypothetical protein
MLYLYHFFLLSYPNETGIGVKTGVQGRAQGGGCQAAAHSHTPQNRNYKTDFVDIISKVLRDFRFSRNQPLKSADD